VAQAWRMEEQWCRAGGRDHMPMSSVAPSGTTLEE
jgi:hypothetical protein